MSDIQIPVAYCSKCDETGPVVYRVITADEWIQIESDYEGPDVTIIYCPQCETILNGSGNVKLKWYSPEDLEKATGWAMTTEPIERNDKD